LFLNSRLSDATVKKKKTTPSGSGKEKGIKKAKTFNNWDCNITLLLSRKLFRQISEMD
jgi:hypothetical protein